MSLNLKKLVHKLKEAGFKHGGGVTQKLLIVVNFY